MRGIDWKESPLSKWKRSRFYAAASNIMNMVCQTAFRRKRNRPRRGLSRPPAELVVEPVAVIRAGKADLMVKMLSTTSSGAQISVCILDADAIKATAKGVTYKIPVTVKCVGRDGVSKDASTTVNVVVKK